MAVPAEAGPATAEVAEGKAAAAEPLANAMAAVAVE